MCRFALRLLCVLPVLSFTGCAGSPPKVVAFDPVAKYEADFDQVWEPVVEFFAVGNLPIDTIEKDSGLIVTSWMDAGSGGIEHKENEHFCDCGKPGFMGHKIWTRGKFSIHVKSAPQDGTELRVTCTFQQNQLDGAKEVVVNCASTGNLEKQIHGYVRAKIAGEQVPDVPTFAPSTNV